MASVGDVCACSIVRAGDNSQPVLIQRIMAAQDVAAPAARTLTPFETLPQDSEVPKDVRARALKVGVS